MSENKTNSNSEKNTPAAENDPGLGPDTSGAENTVEVDVADLKAQLQKAVNDYLYLRAEFDNFRKQTIKERSELLKFGGERLAKDLLETLDIFETAMASDVTTENFKVFVDGIKMTSQQLSGVLKKHGIADVESAGQPFDPFIHEALGSEPTDQVPPGHITKVFKKPYKFHDKVLRPGQVIVAKAKES